jgi:phosphoserine phosphatase
MQFCSAHRLPRAGIDPIDSAESALTVVALAIRRPQRPETVALLLDHERRGISVVIVSGTERPDDVIEVAECLTTAGVDIERVGALVLATVRPGGGVLVDDADRWCDMSDVAADSGIELVEWFVIGDDIGCPRDQLGEPPRWRSG